MSESLSLPYSNSNEITCCACKYDFWSLLSQLMTTCGCSSSTCKYFHCSFFPLLLKPFIRHASQNQHDEATPRRGNKRGRERTERKEKEREGERVDRKEKEREGGRERGRGQKERRKREREREKGGEDRKK